MKMGDAYIIVYSVTDKVSFEKASELRIQLRRARQTEDIPIILVGNKSDLVRSREVSVDGKGHSSFAGMSQLARAVEDHGQQKWIGSDGEKCMIRGTLEKSSQLVYTGASKSSGEGGGRCVTVQSRRDKHSRAAALACCYV